MVLLKSLCFFVLKVCLYVHSKVWLSVFLQKLPKISLQWWFYMNSCLWQVFVIAKCEVCIIASYIANIVIRDNMYGRCSVLVLLVVFVYLFVLQVIVLALCYIQFYFVKSPAPFSLLVVVIMCEVTLLSTVSTYLSPLQTL